MLLCFIVDFALMISSNFDTVYPPDGWGMLLARVLIEYCHMVALITSVFLCAASSCTTETLDMGIRSALQLQQKLASANVVPQSYDITAQVSYVRRSDNAIALGLEDDSGAIITYGRANQISTIPSRGDLIQCRGRIVTNWPCRPSAMIDSIARIGHREPPAPILTTIQRVLHGEHDFRCVKLFGCVLDARRSETNPRWVLLSVTDDNNLINVSVCVNQQLAETYRDLIGTTVELVGICTTGDHSYRPYRGRSIKAIGRDSFRILKTPEQDEVNLPNIDPLAREPNLDLPLFVRCYAEGRILAIWDTQALLKTTEGTLVNLELRQSKKPKCGAIVRVIGIASTDLFNLTLRSTSWRILEPPSCDWDTPKKFIASKEIPTETTRATFAFFNRGKTLRFTGKVIHLPNELASSSYMYVDTDGCAIPVIATSVAEALKSVKVGCTVEITGVCVAAFENQSYGFSMPKISGLNIVLRHPDDIKILSFPPWWTTGRLLALLGIAIAALIGIFIWNRLLNSKSEQRGRALAQEKLAGAQSELKIYERTRLAVELHDSLAQNLTGVSMEIETAERLASEDPNSMLRHIRLAARTLKSCRDELRNCLWDLRSCALEEPDMNNAILRTLSPHVNKARLTVKFNAPRTNLSDNAAHAILCIIRELTLNAIRHGQASAVRIAGSSENGMLLFSVTDNGVGFDPDNCPGVLEGHFGIQGIRERVDQLGGNMSISSSQGNGTKVRIEIPFPTEEDKHEEDQNSNR